MLDMPVQLSARDGIEIPKAYRLLVPNFVGLLLVMWWFKHADRHNFPLLH